MRAITYIALILSVVAIAVALTSQNKFTALKNENEKLIAELRGEQEKLKAEITKLSTQTAKSAETQAAQWPKYHETKGKVLAVVKEANRVVLDHQEIPNLMRAMVMGFEVEDPKLLEGLKEEDEVKVKLKETKTKLTVVGIEKIEVKWPKYHEATGKVLSINAEGNRIVVDEDEIPGFMSAMIMSYETEDPKLLEGLKEGDKVKFKLKETETKLTIVNIEKMEK